MVIALDQFMEARLLSRGRTCAASRFAAWAHGPEIRFDAVGRERFRLQHGLGEKFVVMYPGIIARVILWTRCCALPKRWLPTLVWSFAL